MTEAVVNGKETRCLFINNGDDLLTLKKVVSKKSDKDEAEKHKNNNTKELNGSELNGNHNKTDSINFDVDNTSSLEPYLEMDSDTDRNITIDSVCTQEDRELENIDVSNDNSNETDTKNGDKDNESMALQNSPIEYSPSSSSYAEYTCDLENESLEHIQSPTSSVVSYLNISSRAPLHTNTDDFELKLEQDILAQSILPLTKQIVHDRKRKIEYELEQEKKPSKIIKLWKIIKSPFQTVAIGTAIHENKLPNTSKAEMPSLSEESDIESFDVSETETINENNSELNEPINTDTGSEVKETNQNNVTRGTFCIIM